jgi:hypothetical protein
MLTNMWPEKTFSGRVLFLVRSGQIDDALADLGFVTVAASRLKCKHSAPSVLDACALAGGGSLFGRQWSRVDALSLKRPMKSIQQDMVRIDVVPRRRTKTKREVFHIEMR